MIRIANATVYTLCELFGGVFWGYGSSRKSIIRDNNQRHSANLPCRFDHCETLETRGKVPAPNGPTSDMRRPQGLRSRVARLEGTRGQIDIPRGLGDYGERCSSAASHAPTNRRLSHRIEALKRRDTFDTRTAPSRGLARVGIREARVTTSSYIKSRLFCYSAASHGGRI